MYQSGSVNSGKVKLGISTITDISRPEPIAVAVKEKNISLYSRATSIQQQLATPVRAAPTSHTPFRYPRLPTHPTVQLLYNHHIHSISGKAAQFDPILLRHPNNRLHF